ncbi:MAG: cytochrome c-type biogenesis protein [Pseudomonadota bacterium]
MIVKTLFAQARRVAALLGVVLAIALAGPAAALDPEEKLDDPRLEAKARDITQYLRCVVCDNASVDDSNAQIAKNMRMLVRQRVEEGRSADEILAEFEAYYGEYVRLQPKFSLSNILLWASAPIALLFGLYLSSRRLAPVGHGAVPPEPEIDDAKIAAAPLSEEERRRLQDLLKD